MTNAYESRNKYLFSDVILEVPKTFIAFNKKGDKVFKDPLTKTKSIAKLNKVPSIVLKHSKDQKVHLTENIISGRKSSILDEMKLKKYDKYKKELNNILDDLAKTNDKIEALNQEYNTTKGTGSVKKKNDIKNKIIEIIDKSNEISDLYDKKAYELGFENKFKGSSSKYKEIFQKGIKTYVLSNSIFYYKYN